MNCAGAPPAETDGYNLDADGSCRLGQPSDLSGVDPVLDPLADNGGPTETEALETGSPAIDRGGSSATGCPNLDQRGDPRPSGQACDIGSFEVQSLTVHPESLGTFLRTHEGPARLT